MIIIFRFIDTPSACCGEIHFPSFPISQLLLAGAKIDDEFLMIVLLD
jgi:hypothetical protein